MSESEELIVIKTFSNETDAAMARQVLEDSGIRAFVFKDDAGGMEPHLQRTTGVRLIIDRAAAERARVILQTLNS
jgi:Putative prokaryotic signal transducing protein